MVFDDMANRIVLPALLVVMSDLKLNFALASRKKVYYPNGLAPRHGHSKNHLHINLRVLQCTAILYNYFKDIIKCGNGLYIS